MTSLYNEAQQRYGRSSMEPTRVLPIVALIALVAVEAGGWSLLNHLTERGGLSDDEEQFFRAGHAHAGVLLVLSLIYFVYLDRTGYSAGVQWIAGLLLLLGNMAQSGGFFPISPSAKIGRASCRERV